MSTKTIIFDEIVKEKIEDVKTVERRQIVFKEFMDGQKGRFVPAISSPCTFDNVILLYNYGELDYMLVYNNDDLNHKLIYSGHWNDGVV